MKILILIVSLLLSVPAGATDCALTIEHGTFGEKTTNDPSIVSVLTASCDPPYKIALDAGEYFNGSRTLKNENDLTLSYQLWADAAGTIEWGDIDFGGTYAASPVSIASPLKNTHKIFGKIRHSGSEAPSGVYTDTVTVTLSWSPYGENDNIKYPLDLTFSPEQQCDLSVEGVHGFGSWPTGTENLLGATLGEANVTCAQGVHFALGIDAGQHYDGATRNLVDKDVVIPYTLRTEKNGNEWGDTGMTAFISDYLETHPGHVILETGTGQTQHFFVWGDAGTAGAPAGTYSDQVSFTIVW